MSCHPLKLCLCLLAAVFLMQPYQADAAVPGHYKIIHTSASGTGAYFPATQFYFGPGVSPELGELIYNGTLELEPIGDPANGLFAFRNSGNGTDDEVFQETIYTDGSTLSTRFEGQVQLIPEFDDDGNPTGQFTARWEGVWHVVKGTGKLRGAKGRFDVVAVNAPFNPATDPQWLFTWEWSGTLKVPRHRFFDPCVTMRLTTDGEGVFDPANLGLGDPNTIPFPFIIGDGSGEGIYDGTPTGNNFRLNGIKIGNGFDRHVGTAQSISPGVLFPNEGVFRYPGVNGDNPDGSGRKIHIMKTWLGQIWFEYVYYFELDPAAGTAGVVTGLADFRVVGGTWFFKRARGSVFVKVVADLADADLSVPATPFHYDFRGYLEYCLSH